MWVRCCSIPSSCTSQLYHKRYWFARAGSTLKVKSSLPWAWGSGLDLGALSEVNSVPLVCVCSYGKFWKNTKRSKNPTATFEELRAKAEDCACPLHTPPKRWAKYLSHPFSLTPGHIPTFTPYKEQACPLTTAEAPVKHCLASDQYLLIGEGWEPWLVTVEGCRKQGWGSFFWAKKSVTEHTSQWLLGDDTLSPWPGTCPCPWGDHILPPTALHLHAAQRATSPRRQFASGQTPS